jgi:quercetin dioxygenase-like cupin family protein
VASKTQLGGALRELRREKGSSLVQVADATGISKSFLSLVESGRSDITIGRLLRLVSFYGANISDLLPPDDAHDATVVKRADQRELQSPAEGIRIFLLARNQDRKMTPSLGVIEPSGASAEKAGHAGEEFLHVLQGTITLDFGDGEPISLEEGDSAYFKADRPHSYRNTSDGITRFLTVATPPTF